MKIIFLSAQSTIKKQTISMHLQGCALKITELPTINVFPGSSINTPQFIHFSSSFNLLSPCNNKKNIFLLLSTYCHPVRKKPMITISQSLINLCKFIHMNHIKNIEHNKNKLQIK